MSFFKDHIKHQAGAGEAFMRPLTPKDDDIAPAAARVLLAAERVHMETLTRVQVFLEHMLGQAELVMEGESGKSRLPAKETLRLGYDAARLLVSVSGERVQCAHRQTALERRAGPREDFLNDRALAVVKGTLLELNEHYGEQGFGAWMPFSGPDQWLIFCDLMNKVLAGNGLIHSENAETYMRLLKENAKEPT
jgi:hypothetical protein